MIEINSIILNQQLFQLSIIRSARRKRTLTLKVKSDSSLIVSAPSRINKTYIYTFIHQQSAWIIKRIHELQSCKHRIFSLSLLTNEQVPYLGKNYSLLIVNTVHSEQTIQINNKQLIIFLCGNGCHFEYYMHVKLKLITWYQKCIREILEERIPFWCKLLAVKPKQWRITDARKRWGSCSAQNNVCINWRIIFAPIELIDYLIVHELCHIVHKNHSKDFWQMVSTAIPNYKTCKQALRKQEDEWLTWL